MSSHLQIAEASRVALSQQGTSTSQNVDVLRTDGHIIGGITWDGQHAHLCFGIKVANKPPNPD